MPVEVRLELSAVIRLQSDDPECQSLSDLVQDADCCALISPIVDLQYPDPCAVVESGELIEPFVRSGMRSRNFPSICRWWPGCAF